MSEDLSAPQTPPAAPRWQPLGAIDRRVLGVLAEKAKTTPDTYPMSLNGIATGCNQKSNRDPLMQLAPDDVAEALERLRQLGAVGMVEGYGRVTKYRHYLYDWLGVEKIELSVMTELLLRGAQTEGELRGRVSRMDPIADLPALRALLASLEGKGLVLALTPAGRGHVVSHALYTPRELEQVRAQYERGGAAVFSRDELSAAAPAPLPAPAAGDDSLRRELEDLRQQIALVRGELHDLSAQQQHLQEDVRGLKDALGR